MGIEAGIASVASLFLGTGTAAAATAATIGTIGAATLAVGAGAYGISEISKMGGGGKDAKALMPSQNIEAPIEEEEVTVGSGNARKKGRESGRRQLMAAQASPPKEKSAGTTGLNV